MKTLMKLYFDKESGCCCYGTSNQLKNVFWRVKQRTWIYFFPPIDFPGCNGGRGALLDGRWVRWRGRANDQQTRERTVRPGSRGSSGSGVDGGRTWNGPWLRGRALGVARRPVATTPSLTLVEWAPTKAWAGHKKVSQKLLVKKYIEHLLDQKNCRDKSFCEECFSRLKEKTLFLQLLRRTLLSLITNWTKGEQKLRRIDCYCKCCVITIWNVERTNVVTKSESVAWTQLKKKKLKHFIGASQRRTKNWNKTKTKKSNKNFF
jgi:hypothetical protein